MWNVSEYSLWEQRTKILTYMYVFWKLVHISSCVIEDFSFGLTITDFCHLLKSSFRCSKGVFTPVLPNQFKSNSGSFFLVKFICAIAFGPVHNSWTETLWRQWSQNELQSGDQTTIQLNCQMYAKVWSDHLWVAKYVLHSVTFYHKYSEVTKFKLIILYYFYCSCPTPNGCSFGCDFFRKTFWFTWCILGVQASLSPGISSYSSRGTQRLPSPAEGHNLL